MTTKHTPGPWAQLGFHGQYPKQGIYVEPRTDTRVGPTTALVYVNNNNEHARQQAMANARLIAAAPDLLEACMARIKFDAKVGREPGVDEGPLPQSRINVLAMEQADIVEQMVKAIAKAVGGAV